MFREEQRDTFILIARQLGEVHHGASEKFGSVGGNREQFSKGHQKTQWSLSIYPKDIS